MPSSDQLETPELLLRKTQSSHWYVEWMDAFSAHFHAVKKAIAAKTTPFQQVEIYETPKFGRLLVLDGDPQSSAFDEDIYHEALVHPALVTHPNPKNVLILGGGEGATLREVLRHSKVEKAVMVDIDGEVVDLCRKELPSYSKGAFEDRRTQLVIDDANKFLKDTSIRFDVVISDLTLPYPDTPSEGLVTEAFFGLIKNKMTPDAVFAMQASRTERGMNALFIHNIGVLKKIWKIVRPYHAFIPSFYSDWGYILASDKCDPIKLVPETVDQRLSAFSSSLHYYDGLLHPAMFTLPKELRC